MQWVVFFRNLNLGRPPAPTRLQLEAAFVSAGATSATSFLTNGTLVFETSSLRKARQVLAGACAELHEASGFQEPGFLREIKYLQSLVRREPFAAIDASAVYGQYITFLDAQLKLPADPAYANSTHDVRVVEYTPTELLSVAYQRGKSPGSPNAFAERQFGHPATTRAWNTVCRLVQKHA